MHLEFSLCVINLLVAVAAAFYVPQDPSSAIEQPAGLPNTSRVSIINETFIVSGYAENTVMQSLPILNITTPTLPLDNALLKDTQVLCSRHIHGTVKYPSCLDALNTLNLDRARLYTFGQRDTGLYDINLPFRLLSCMEIYDFYSFFPLKPTLVIPTKSYFRSQPS